MVLMNEPNGLTPPGSVGCSSLASLSSCWRNVSYSTGTTVRSRGITALSAITGPPLKAGVSCRARDVTSVGDRIAALASAGTLYLLSYQNEILTRSGCGSILSILPTFTPRMRTSSPT